jgi:hypothetical protein
MNFGIKRPQELIIEMYKNKEVMPCRAELKRKMTIFLE